MGIRGDQVGVGDGLVVEVERRGEWQRRQGAVKSSSCGHLLSALWPRLYCMKNSVSDLALPSPPRTQCMHLFGRCSVNDQRVNFSSVSCGEID